MKKFKVLLILCLSFISMGVLQAQNFGGGAGTAGDPYKVATPEHLNEVRNYLSSYFLQTGDIDLTAATSSGGIYYNSGAGWLPIGNNSSRFLGNYNGGGFSITGMFINRPTTAYNGLFGYVGNDVVIPSLSNIKLLNVNVTGSSYTAALAGQVNKTNILKSSANGTISGAGFTGGLIGAVVSAGTVDQSFSLCSVSSSQAQTGGFVGYIDVNVTITNSYSRGNVSCTNSVVGGFVGQARSASTMTNCYSTGTVSGTANIGGFIGVLFSSTINSSYWDTQSSGLATSDGGSGKTTAQMQTQATFSGWDFTNIWYISNNYPEFNYTLPGVSIYLTRDNTDVNANILYPKVGFGSDITSPFSWTPVSPDWTYNAPKCTMYVVPTGSEGMVASSFVVAFDPEKASVSASAATNNLFDSGIFYTQATASGRLKINASNTSSAINVTPGSGKYLARLIFTMLKPGHLEVTLDSLDFRQYDTTNNEQVSLTAENNAAEVKFYLGDIASSSAETTGDGLINVNDLSLFATSYWSIHSQSSTLYKSKFDIGPTNVSGNYFALPTPDGAINFEDLVIFSVGYGKSAGSQLPKINSTPFSVTLGEQLQGKTVRVPVTLSGKVADVRAMSFTFKTGMKLVGVEKAGALNTSNGFVIFKQEGDVVRFDAAVIGSEVSGISEEGTIAYLVFENKGSISFEEVIARDSWNQNLPTFMKGNSLENAVTESFSLLQNYPNPFNPSTMISFALPAASQVTLKVFNALGQEVATLINNELFDAGTHAKSFNAADMVTGMYLYKLTAGSFTATKKMVLIK